MINSILYKNNNTSKTELWYTQQETTSNSICFKEIKNRATRSKSLDYNTIKSL